MRILKKGLEIVGDIVGIAFLVFVGIVEEVEARRKRKNA